MIFRPTDRARLTHLTPVGQTPSRTQIEIRDLPDDHGFQPVDQLERPDDLFLVGQFETEQGGLLLFIEEGAFETRLLIRYYNPYGALDDWAELSGMYHNLALRDARPTAQGVAFSFGQNYVVSLAERPFRRILAPLQVMRAPRWRKTALLRFARA